MIEVLLMDGTQDSQAENALKVAVDELAKCVGLVNLKGTGYNPQMYNLVKSLESKSYDSRRRQVNTEELILNAYDKTKAFPGLVVIATDQDLFSPGINWCFGTSTGCYETDNLGRRVNERDYIIGSKSRMQSFGELVFLFAHEMGHKFGAAPSGRRNTVENLGSHCTNNNCIMQQNVNLNEAIRYAQRLYKKLERGEIDSLFCNQCGQDLRNNNQ
ncbi:MAG: hypothetical protein JW791_04640 [Nanoarchaeota archaeon]|nr:hypothetical protein [Nanoarchaeota archaeon]